MSLPLMVLDENLDTGYIRSPKDQRLIMTTRSA